MRKLLFVVFLLGFSPFAIAQQRQVLKTEIDKIIHYDTKISLEKIPGFIITVILGDSTYYFAYGSVVSDQKIKPHQESLFELGGVTKIFTALLIEDLVSSGKLSYETKFNSLLFPAFQNPAFDDLAILDLLTHSSGLPKMPTEFGVKEIEDNNPYKHYTKLDLLQFYKTHLPILKKEYLYSNVNYALLEIAIESIYNMPFELALQEFIFQPIGMNSSFIGQQDTAQLSEIAQGYSLGRKPVGPWNFLSFAASEGIKSHSKDLELFLRKNIEASDHEDVYKMNKLHTALVPTLHSRDAFAGKGWHVLKTRKYFDAYMHTGKTSGHRSFLGFVKETRTGVIVLSNSEHEMNGLGFLILRMLNNHWKKRKNKQ